MIPAGRCCSRARHLHVSVVLSAAAASPPGSAACSRRPTPPAPPPRSTATETPPNAGSDGLAEVLPAVDLLFVNRRRGAGDSTRRAATCSRALARSSPHAARCPSSSSAPAPPWLADGSPPRHVGVPSVDVRRHGRRRRPLRRRLPLPPGSGRRRPRAAASPSASPAAPCRPGPRRRRGAQPHAPGARRGRSWPGRAPRRAGDRGPAECGAVTALRGRGPSGARTRS